MTTTQRLSTVTHFTSPSPHLTLAIALDELTTLAIVGHIESSRPYYDRFTDLFAQWLAEPPHRFKVRLANMDRFLKYVEPTKTTEQLHAMVLNDLLFRLHPVKAQGIWPFDCLDAVSFMSLAEYKVEVSELALRRLFLVDVPENPRCSIVPWANPSPIAAEA